MAGTIILADYLHPSNDLRNKQVSYWRSCLFSEDRAPWINEKCIDTETDFIYPSCLPCRKNCVKNFPFFFLTEFYCYLFCSIECQYTFCDLSLLKAI